jgi:phosphoribosylformimino-5-aminoimidazole carboxamide ribotide isomerase
MGALFPWILAVHIIPVLDIKDGLVVHARMGERNAYRPIETPLSATAGLLDVANGLQAVYPFGVFYIADLDAILRPAAAETILARVQPLLGNCEVWIDAGFSQLHQLETVLAAEGVHPVLGSESQQDASLLRHLRSDPKLILSLDFRGDEFIGPPSILENSEDWPARIIVMTLGRIGGNAGPDFDRLAAIRQSAGGRAVVAAGGIRNADDLRRLNEMGISGALVATSLHNGALNRQTIAGFIG